MDDLNLFERRFADRVRRFAQGGTGPVDAAAVARSVASGHSRRAGGARTIRWIGFSFDRRLWALALALGLLATLLVGAILVGSGLLPSRPLLVDLSPAPSPVPTTTLVTPSPSSSPSPSPVALRLAHLVYVLDGDIYVADGDGTNGVRIVDASEDWNADCHDVVEEDGLVSPDGRHVAYRSNWGETCQGAVVITDLDGRFVASLPGAGRGIAWAPDSTRVATWLTWNGPTIGVYGLDGVLQAVLDGSSVCCDQDYSRPAWSRDGASLLIGTHGDGSPSDWELPVNGATPRLVPEDELRLRGSAYSPDGTRVAFIATDFIKFVERVESLVVAAPDGTQRHVLVQSASSSAFVGAKGFGSAPLWSPRGDRIAFIVIITTVDREGFREIGDLRLVDPVTGVSTTLATGPNLQPLAFSPEGDRILYGQDGEGGQDAGLWMVSVDGSGARLLVAGTSVGAWVSVPADAEGASTP